MYELLIWWLSQEDFEGLTEEVRESLPPYIHKEVESLDGRNGRGRLWVPKDIDLNEIDWRDEHPNAKRIHRSSAGGVVFLKGDYPTVKDLPGFITDLRLETVD